MRQKLLVLLVVSITALLPKALATEQKQRHMMTIGKHVVSLEIGNAFVHAQEMMDAKNYEQAGIELQALLKKAPELAPIQYKYAFVLLQQNKLEKASSHARRCTELDPQFVGGWLTLGEASMRMHKDEEALTALKKALQLQPDGENADIARELIASIESASTDSKSEAMSADQATANRKIMTVNHALQLCNEAGQLIKKGEFAAALKKCHEAARLAPGSDQVSENLVVCLNNYAADCVQKQRLKQAEALLTEALNVQKGGHITRRSYYTTLKNYHALLEFTGRSKEAKAMETQLKKLQAR